jgi:hypothetical protein
MEFYDHNTEERFICHDDVTVERETDKALLCVIAGEEHWVPKSQIADESEVFAENTRGTLVIKRWLAEQKGWA